MVEQVKKYVVYHTCNYLQGHKGPSWFEWYFKRPYHSVRLGIISGLWTEIAGRAGLWKDPTQK